LQNFFTSFFLFFLKNIRKYFYITFLSGSCFEPSSDLPFPVPGEDIEPVVVPGDIPGVVPGSEPEYYEHSTRRPWLPIFGIFVRSLGDLTNDYRFHHSGEIANNNINLYL